VSGQVTTTGTKWLDQALNKKSLRRTENMKIGVASLTAILLLGTVNGADAKGCLKGALVGGVAGHYAGHHGVLGAAAGCVVGRHEAKKHERQRIQDEQRNREQQDGAERL
jgi:outer membrane lipoprotein SlyB